MARPPPRKGTVRPRAEVADTGPVIRRDSAARSEVIDAESVPWIPFEPYSTEVMVKYFRLDPTRGETVLLLRAPAGAALPRLHQCGRIIVYTIEGRWKHREDDWIAGPGSVVLEPAASDHTVAVVAGDGPLVALLVVVGDVLFIGPRGEVLAIENWKSAQQRYLAYCARSAIQPRDLTRTTQDWNSP